jgi:hypothetical protein
MTLREKFKTEVSINTDGEAGRFATKCEVIADEYAIEFAEWSVARAMGLDSFKLNNGELETFKKEKGYE